MMTKTKWLISEIMEDRDAGTEDAWWLDRMELHLEDLGQYGDEQDLTDKRRIFRIPALERAVLSMAAERDALKADMEEIDDAVGSWLSAAWEDPNVCNEMKQGIERFFSVLDTHLDRDRFGTTCQGEIT